MKEVFIHHLEQLPKNKQTSPERQLIDQHLITQKDINRLANILANEIVAAVKQAPSPDQEKHIVLDILSIDAMFERVKKFGLSDYEMTRDLTKKKIRLTKKESGRVIDEEELSKDDVAAFVQPIRDAILTKLRALNPDLYIHLVELTNEPASRVKPFRHEDTIMKDLRFADAQKQNVVAIRRLHELPDTSPSLSYSHLARNQEQTKELQEKLSFTTFDQLAKKHLLPPVQLLRAFLDIIRGVRFLIDHQFVLSDLKLANMACDQKTGQGFLFDFDSLYNADDPDRFYLSTPHITAPEMHFREQNEFDWHQSVFELGVSLYDLMEKETISADERNRIGNLANSMCHQSPDLRTSIPDIENRLQNIIDDMSGVPLQQAA